MVLATLPFFGVALPRWASDPIVGRASVVDGDTIEIHGTRIRLSGVDAPESGQLSADKTTGSPIPCGRRAALFLADMLGAKVVACFPEGHDRYGRTLAHCRVGDGDVGDALVRAGWAMSFTRYSREYDPAERDAEAAVVGLWAMDFVPPWEWRRGR